MLARSMKVMSFNIWSDAPRNRSWGKRREGIANVLRRDDLDVIGLQEASAPMIRDLHQVLPHFAWVGVGREDGVEAGEYTPIFYRRERYAALDCGHFWLAEPCDQPKRGWDALCRRVVTWVRLLEHESGRRVIHLNTHLDHFGRQARLESARLLLRKVDEISGGDPVVVTGDFNCREMSAPYLLLTGRPPFGKQAASGLRDTRYDSALPPEGPRKTYRGLLGLLGLGRIDYIFVKNGLKTRRYAVLDEAVGASDHRPVLADLSLDGGEP